MRTVVYHIILLILFSACAFFVRLGDLPLLDPDEARYAETARQMMVRGEYFVPYFNDSLRLEKPAFFHWFVVAAYKILGVTETAARFPAACFGCVGVLLIYFLGRMLFHEGIGFLAGIMLATSLGYMTLSRLVLLETMLTVWIVSSLFAFWGWYVSSHRRFLVLFYVAMAIGVLVKGPIGFIEPFLAAIVFLLVRKKAGHIRAMGLWWGIPLMLALAFFPYYKEYLASIGLGSSLGLLRTQTSGRFFEGFIHQAHFLYYVPVLLGGAFPWWVITLSGISFRKKSARQSRESMPDEDLFLWSWFWTIFIFFSLSQSKVATYILPAFFPFMIICARYAYDLLRDKKRALFRRLLPFIMLLIVWGGILGGGTYYLKGHYPGTEEYVYLLFAVTMSGSLAAFIAAAANKRRGAITAVVCTMIAFCWVLLDTAGPVFGDYRSTKNISQYVKDIIEPDTQVVSLNCTKPSAVFYLQRPVKRFSYDELIAQWGAGQHIVCYVKNKDYDDLTRELAGNYSDIVTGDRVSVIENK